MGWDLSLHHLIVLSKAQGKKGFFQVAKPHEKSTFKPLGLNTASVSPRHTEPLSSGLSLALKGLFPDNGTVLSLSLLHLLAIYKLQCLIFGPRDLFLPPRRGPSGLVVLHQEVRTPHLAGLPLAVLPAAAGALPLAGIGDVVEVINAAWGQREGWG